jgi:hypothetical protein
VRFLIRVAQKIWPAKWANNSDHLKFHRYGRRGISRGGEGGEPVNSPSGESVPTVKGGGDIAFTDSRTLVIGQRGGDGGPKCRTVRPQVDMDSVDILQGSP